MADGYRVTFAERAAKVLRKLPKELQRRIIAKAESLADDPRPAGSTKLAGHDHLYRVRIGDYRIVYTIQDDQRIVIIVIVGHRRDVYRGL